jgi:hypothetical protein
LLIHSVVLAQMTHYCVSQGTIGELTETVVANYFDLFRNGLKYL